MLLLFLSSSSFAQLSNGIYAVFDTSMGGITARLDYVKAPMTVANFIGLAEGTQTWYDENEGVPRNDPFYNGTIVNRIAELNTNDHTFIVQSGSRNGTNSGGGPGYNFRDEFDDSLRHDRPGVISMANSGKNSNGSQYFFSLGPLPHLDDVHSVFGEVISGLNVLTNISEVPLTNSKPETDVVFDQINILRVGQDASNFVITGHGLPVVTSLPVRINSASNNAAVHLDYAVRTNSQFVFSSSSTLQDWMKGRTVWSTDIPVSSSQYYAVTSSLAFYAATCVDYEDRLFVPSTAHGYRFTDTSGNFDFYLNATNNTGVVLTTNGVVADSIWNWRWTPDAYRSRLFVAFFDQFPKCATLTFCFTNSAANYYQYTPQMIVNVVSGMPVVVKTGDPISGTFTYERFAP